jgi:hypothetical protein
MKNLRAMPLLPVSLLAILAGNAPISGQDFTPPQAWAELRAHGAAVQEMYMQYDGTLVQIQNLMKRSAPYSAAGNDLLAFRNLVALKHREAVYTLWSSAGGGAISNALRIAHNDFAQLERLRDRFLQLADQMEKQRTPQAEKEFTQYLHVFSGRVRDLDRTQFEPIFDRVGELTKDCALHGDLASRFAAPTQQAIDFYYNQTKPRDRAALRRHEDERNQMKAKDDRLIATFRDWDARQGRVVAAGEVVRTDWRRVHEDTRALAEKLESPDFISELPDIDAKIVVDTLARIKGYLQTYR